MHRTRIKICGITRTEDLRAAVAAGADAHRLCVLSAQSALRRRWTSPRTWPRQVPPFVTRVGLFVNAEAAAVRATLARCRSICCSSMATRMPHYCEQFGRPYIKAARVRSRGSIC